MSNIKYKNILNAVGGALKRLQSSLKATAIRILQYNALKRNNFSVTFVHEGSIIVKLPKVPVQDVIFNIGVSVSRNISYTQRPNAEVLLRKTIFEMYDSGYIDSGLSIIDIGCWISDNSILWSQYLTGSGILFAIDPSEDNLSYGKTLAELNSIKNIKFIKAVCAECPRIKLDFDGSIDHARFKKRPTKKYIESSTIDEIVIQESSTIGFLHVDVEGFELAVLKGAERVIKRDMPVISFEQHISTEQVSEVTNYLKQLNYRLFMINEVLPGCALDCRNFLALPSDKGIPELVKFKQSDGINLGIYSAVVGESVLEV